jgi:hypothetical protein
LFLASDLCARQACDLHSVPREPFRSLSWRSALDRKTKLSNSDLKTFPSLGCQRCVWPPADRGIQDRIERRGPAGKGARPRECGLDPARRPQATRGNLGKHFLGVRARSRSLRRVWAGALPLVTANATANETLRHANDVRPRTTTLRLHMLLCISLKAAAEFAGHSGAHEDQPDYARPYSVCSPTWRLSCPHVCPSARCCDYRYSEVHVEGSVPEFWFHCTSGAGAGTTT